MKKIRLGKSELEVTKIGFGGIPIQRLDEDDAVEVVRCAIESGMNWIDTAYGYTNSQERIGKAIETYPRSDIKIFTKNFSKTPEEMDRQLRDSLEALRVDYIDLFQFHNIDSINTWQEMHENGTVDVITAARDSGIVRHIGVSSHSFEAILDIMDDDLIEVVQWAFNFIVDDKGIEVLSKCEDKDIGIIGMKPFGGGILSEAEPCIRFLMQYPLLPVNPGFETAEQVREVVEIANTSTGPTKDDLAYIERTRTQVGRRFCRRCGYCSPCSQGVSIVGLMTMESLVNQPLPKLPLS